MRKGLFSEKFRGQVAARFDRRLDGAFEIAKSRSIAADEV